MKSTSPGVSEQKIEQTNTEAPGMVKQNCN